MSSHLHTHRRAKHRAGMSLIETAGMVVTIGLVLSLSATALSRVYETHHESIRHLRFIRTMQLMSNRIVQDCHRCTTASADDGLSLKMDDGRMIRYSLNDNLLSRTTTLTETPDAVEQWKIPVSMSATWSMDRSESVAMMTVEFSYVDEPELHPFRWSARCELSSSELYSGQPNLTTGEEVSQ